MSYTSVSISEYTHSSKEYDRRNRINISDGIWTMGFAPDEQALYAMLNFLEIELIDLGESNYNHYVGWIKHYVLSKEIVDTGLYFWTVDQVLDFAKGLPIKKVKGMSNGSIVDCYVVIGDSEITVFRPNPNALEVYVPMEFEDSIEFKKNNWYL